MSILQDARYALRRFLAAPGFIAVAAATLALAIGATTAIYSIVDALLLRPLPYANPERLVEVNARTPTGRVSAYFDRDQLAALATRTDLFAGVAAFDYLSGTLPGSAEPRHDAGLAIGGAMMHILGVPPHLGRLIQPADARPGSPPIMVLSYAAWQDQFGADPQIVGRTIAFEGQSVEIVGVMPRSFNFVDGRRRFWVPLPEAREPGRPSQVIARIRADQTIEEARTRIRAATIMMASRDRGAVAATLDAQPLGSRRVNAPVRTAIYVLAGAVCLVLLIACANIANLLLVQNAGRDREVAVRAALGASRWRLLRQLFTEAALLTAIGGGLGLLVAQWAIDLLAAVTPEDMTFLSVHQIALDWRVLLFAATITAVTGILFGLLPALKSSRFVLFDALKAGARTATLGGRQERLRRGFVVMQLAASCVLLVGAGLLTRTFVHLLRVDPGFDAGRLAMVTLQLPQWKYPTGQDRRQFYDRLVERVKALPGVEGATLSAGAPPYAGGFSFGLTLEVEGRGVVLDDPALVFPNFSVAPDYFSVMGIPLKAGQTFASYASPGSEPVVVISEHLAARLWRGESPVGKRFRMGTGPTDRWYTVVAVAGDVYQLGYGDTSEQLAYYFPARRDVASQVQTIVVRTTGDPSSTVRLLREQIRGLDPGQPIWRLGTVEHEYAEFFAVPRFYMFLMTTFAAIGLTIACVGLYGVLAYSIAQRTREFGIRLALGASRADVLWSVLRTGALMTGIGLAIGAVGSLLVTRSLATLLVDIPPTDPITYAAVAMALMTIALAACWIPARRATRVDPVVALRSE